MTTNGITVAIPAHGSRVHNGMLNQAVQSVNAQTLMVSGLAIAYDKEGLGAAATRQRALDMVDTRWVAFLDSDDELLPRHLELLMQCARDTDADYTFSWFVRSRGGDPLGHFGKVFDPKNPHHTTMTVLVRTELAKQAGFVDHESANPGWSGEDWRFTLRCIELGAKIVHHPEETWIWRRHSGNTSGVAGRGDAR